ncbi:MAG: imidazolonepropionase [Xanthomonadales bacterium]|nr:imidazolonepropionase [Xanthomonadales bacterium]
MATQAPWDTVLIGADLVTLAGESGWGLIEDGALGVRDGRIVHVGPAAALPRPPEYLARSVERFDGGLLTPALIDCHTHLVFAGHRGNEFEARLEGASYEAIARAGGGIASTVRATRAASEQELLAASLPRARALLEEGVTCIEVKSGYGLELDTERRMLRVARRIGERLNIEVRTTFLGLHAVPAEFADRRGEYVAMVCDRWLPALAAEGLVDAVDAFCEGIGFSPAESARCLDAAAKLDLPVKLHAEQLSDQGGAALVAARRGLSADHLEWLGPEGIAAMADAGTVAVLLPGAFYALRETRLPPIQALRDAGVPMAVATDLNPGTSPMPSLRLALNMACTLFRLSPAEALRGACINAARALGLGHERGRLEPGMRADLLHWAVRDPAELPYWIGPYPRPRLLRAGVSDD